MTTHTTSVNERAERIAGGSDLQRPDQSGWARLARSAGWFGLGLGTVLLLMRRKQQQPEYAVPAEIAPPRDVHARAAITINAPVADVFRLWNGFDALPRFMRDVATVEIVDERHSRWNLAAPAGRTLTWDVEITDARPNERIAWQTAAGSRLTAQGEVRFRPAPGNRGTEVIFDAIFSPPGGEAGRRIASLVADVLGTKLGNDLRRSKQLVELGEIVQSDDSIIPGPNPAQPSARHAA
jgi:uncharacterized membrane protein